MANESILQRPVPPHPSGAGRVTRSRHPASGWLLALLLSALLLAIWWRTAGGTPPALAHLWQWSPALAHGMWTNIYISLLAMALGTLVGLLIGAASITRHPWLRRAVQLYVQAFRNAPVLVLIYFTTYVFPFELVFGHWRLPFPDWIKVVVGLALPASANVAEIFRAAIQSIPSAQWEAAQSLALRRTQIFRWIILPQSLRRMLPPWMNLYASITMSTSLASLVGVHDIVDTAQIASNAVMRTDFTVLIYFTILALFFVYCYPIARYTRRLEKRHARH